MEGPRRILKNLPSRWISLFVAVVATAAVLSFLNEVHTAQTAVEKYVGIWEDDIARARIFQGDPGLQNKILKQLKEVNSSVILAEAVEGRCLFSNSVPVTYNSLPVGEMKLCYQPGELVLKAATSPLMMLAILLGTAFLSVGFRREFAARLHEQKLKSELALNKEIAEISRQVAHDIRGPLTALTTLSQLSHEMSGEKRELLSLAVARINGIAEDLLKKGKENPLRPSGLDQLDFTKEAKRGEGGESPAPGGAGILRTPLLPLVESLLKEYKFAHPRAQFSWHNHVTSEVSVNLEAVKIQRVLSNLLNNSIEALPESEATIDITIMERADSIILQIMDNGCGIPEDVLPKLMSEGYSYGKEKGHGLGLYDAHKTLQSIGGDLQIRSRFGVGTQVIMQFPKRVLTSEEIKISSLA